MPTQMEFSIDPKYNISNIDNLIIGEAEVHIKEYYNPIINEIYDLWVKPYEYGK